MFGQSVNREVTIGYVDHVLAVVLAFDLQTLQCCQHYTDIQSQVQHYPYILLDRLIIRPCGYAQRYILVAPKYEGVKTAYTVLVS